MVKVFGGWGYGVFLPGLGWLCDGGWLLVFCGFALFVLLCSVVAVCLCLYSLCGSQKWDVRKKNFSIVLFLMEISLPLYAQLKL